MGVELIEEILESLQLSLEEENWDRIVEVIQKLEKETGGDYKNYYDDPDNEIDF